MTQFNKTTKTTIIFEHTGTWEQFENHLKHELLKIVSKDPKVNTAEWLTNNIKEVLVLSACEIEEPEDTSWLDCLQDDTNVFYNSNIE